MYGTANTFQMVQYNIDSNHSMDDPSYLSSILGNVYGEYGIGVFYTQINDTLYTIRESGDYIHVYNLENLLFDTLQSHIPKMVDNSACLASSQSPSPQLYVTGGQRLQTYYDMYDFQILNLNDNVWTVGANMNYNRSGHGCIVVNDWLWVMGYVPEIEGIDIANSDSSEWERLSSDTLPSELQTLQSFGIVAEDEYIYILGGSACGPTIFMCPSDTLYIIDTNMRAVSNSTLPYDVAGMSVVIADGILYGFGGYGCHLYDDGGICMGYNYLDSWISYELLSDEADEP